MATPSRLARPLLAGLASLAAAIILAAPAAAAEGTTVYATANCFVFETSEGLTLFERSGGAGAQEGQVVKGGLNDFGYQELKDAQGRDLLVGWVQNYGVTDQAEVEDFKKTCR